MQIKEGPYPEPTLWEKMLRWMNHHLLAFFWFYFPINTILVIRILIKLYAG